MTTRKRYLAALVAVLAIALPLLGLAITDSQDSQGNHTITVSLRGVHGTKPHSITVPKAIYDRAKAGIEKNLRTENPDGVTQKQLDAAEQQQEALAATDQLPIVTPDAAPQQRGCTTRLVRNYSTRSGVKPRVFVLHYTVSANRTGTGDVDAIVGLFDRASYQASSNYVMDNEGNCRYIVRESDKAWTQAAANPFSISVEMVNTGHEPTYAGTAGLAKLAMVASDSLKRWGIPVQRGLVSGCVVRTPGIVDHASLGACGGGHHDITPYSVPQVIAAVKAYRAAEGQPKPRTTYSVKVTRADGSTYTVVRDSPARYLLQLNISKSKLKGAVVSRMAPK